MTRQTQPASLTLSSNMVSEMISCVGNWNCVLHWFLPQNRYRAVKMDVFCQLYILSHSLLIITAIMQAKSVPAWSIEAEISKAVKVLCRVGFTLKYMWYCVTCTFIPNKLKDSICCEYVGEWNIRYTLHAAKNVKSQQRGSGSIDPRILH
jgi:hypothetical protein